MSATSCAQPLTSAELIDYSLGELDAERERSVEAHLFACEACCLALEAVVDLSAAIARSVGEGGATAAVTDALVERAARRGARVREYRLAPGETVACTAAPDDAFVAIRLSGPFEGVTAVAIETAFEDLSTGDRATRRLEDVPVDAAAHALVLLFPGDAVRAYPRSRWTMRARGLRGGEAVDIGPYTLDHTPWNELPGR